MFSGGGFGVGLTVADLTPPSPEFGPPVTATPSLGELLPVYARTAAPPAQDPRPGWTYVMTPDGILTVTASSDVTRTSRPPGLQLTGPRVLTRPPEPGPGRHPPPASDPADDLPPF
jgi:hypothetical protein